MYIPDHFRCTDRDTVFDLLDETMFGLFLTGEDATWLPFIVLDRNPGQIFAHFARSNPHARHIGSGAESTLMVQGPHCYISPNQYRHQQTVPTWNFLAVQLKGRLIDLDQEQLIPLMKQQIEVYEGEEGWSYSGLEEGYFDRVTQGVVGFLFEIGSFDAKFKLNQKKRRSDQESVISSLKQGKGDEPEVARWMQRLTLGNPFTKPDED
ncbi:FMN-binding negative transcriptional regulator [bacterium]|nr:FMN-binding negative transcriptional regulator [bacterium]